MFMLPPTYLTCLEVGHSATVADVLAAAHDRRVDMFTPTLERDGDRDLLSIPERMRPLLEGRG